MTPKEQTDIQFIAAFEAFQTKVHENAVNKGFWDNPIQNQGEKIALIHSEISEALEGLRKGLMDDHIKDRPMVEVELADAIIRIMDMAGHWGYDVAGAMVEKHHYNTSRPYKHGKKF